MRLKSPPASGSPERLSYRKRELPGLIGLPLRSLERAIASGAFPGPDRRVGRVGLWSVETLRRWLNGGGR